MSHQVAIHVIWPRKPLRGVSGTSLPQTRMAGKNFQNVLSDHFTHFARTSQKGTMIAVMGKKSRPDHRASEIALVRQTRQNARPVPMAREVPMGAPRRPGAVWLATQV